MKSSWNYIISGEYETAIKAAQYEIANCLDDYNETFNLGSPVTEGMALLCLRRYDDAYDHFSRLIKKTRWKSSTHFIGAGLARWFANETDDAFKVWKRGLKAGYAVLQGLDIRFIMYYAAVRAGNSEEIENAIDEIRTRTYRDEDIPGQIARFLLGEIDERQLYKTSSQFSRNGERDAEDQLALDFYVGVVALRDGRQRRCLNLMRKANQFDRVDLGGAWLFELIIARKEAKII